jgi:hypothetical protein
MELDTLLDYVYSYGYIKASIINIPRILLRVRGALFLGVKLPGREADHSPPSSAKVKECVCVQLYLHSPTTPSWRGAQ